MRHPLILSIAVTSALVASCARPARLAADLVMTRANLTSVQPYNAIGDGRWTERRIGADVQVLTTIAGGKVVRQRRP